ncbi:MAG: hypothetical protein F6K39_14125 [Okeania sp. SIO3B3]|nr:hypothetical protein [Okeania sp. SIO3B3]
MNTYTLEEVRQKASPLPPFESRAVSFSIDTGTHQTHQTRRYEDGGFEFMIKS